MEHSRPAFGASALYNGVNRQKRAQKPLKICQWQRAAAIAFGARWVWMRFQK
jgi:hypothetical protein